MITRASGPVRRVAVLAYHSSPLAQPGSGDSGGMTIYVREVASALARLGVATDIFTRATDSGNKVTSLSPSVRVVAIEAGPVRPLDKETLRPYVDDFAAGVRSYAAHEGISYDIVHSHYWQSGIAGASLATWWAIPFVHSYHTLGRVKNRFLAPGDMPESENRLRGEDEVIRAADVLIASTDDEWDQLACLYGANHDLLKTINPGVDHSLFSPGDRSDARRQLALAQDAAVVLGVARIQPLKGLELAIRATEQLAHAREGQVVLVIVGGASGRSGREEVGRLKALVRDLNLEANVRFAGPHPHDRLPTYYRAADVVTVTSHAESFGLTALEAQSCAIPVVGTAVGGLSFVVADGLSGFLVNSRDPSVFAARLKDLVADAALRGRFGQVGAASAMRFSWSMTAERLLELYDCLARETFPEVCTC